MENLVLRTPVPPPPPPPSLGPLDHPSLPSPPPPPRAVAEAQQQARGKTTETTEQAVVPKISDLPLAAAAWAHGVAQWQLPQHPGGQAEGAGRREEGVVWSTPPPPFTLKMSDLEYHHSGEQEEGAGRREEDVVLSTPPQLSASDVFDLGYYLSDEQEEDEDESDQEPYGSRVSSREPSPESNEKNAPGLAGWVSNSDSETNNKPRRQRSKRRRPVSDDDEDADDEREEGDMHSRLSSRPKKKMRRGGAKFHPRMELKSSLPRPAESHWAAHFGQDLDEPTTAVDDGEDADDEGSDEEASCTVYSATLAGDDDEDEDEDEPRYSGMS